MARVTSRRPPGPVAAAVVILPQPSAAGAVAADVLDADGVDDLDDGGGDDIADDLDEGAEGEGGEEGEEGEEGVIKGGGSAVWTMSKNF